MKSASDFRKTAWNALSGKWGLALGTGLVASLLGANSMSSPSININTETQSEQNSVGITGGAEVNFAEIMGVFSILLIVILPIILAISLVYYAVGSTVRVGYARFNLELIDTNDSKFVRLFSFFPKWWRATLTALLRDLFIFLWALLLIIPGIIASYSYAMTDYILAENPDISPNEAITRSKKMMSGNRWRLFCLNFSFIGWDILCILSCGIGSLWINPYKNAALADFYREISGTRPVEEPFEEVILTEKDFVDAEKISNTEDI